MKKFLLLFILFVFHSCASTNANKYCNSYSCFDRELDRRMNIVYGLWDERSECKNLPENEALKCIEELQPKIDLAEKRVESQRRLIKSYNDVQYKELLREHERASAELNNKLKSINEGSGNEDNDYDVWLDILSLADNALNPKPFKFDTSLMPDLDNTLYQPSFDFSAPNQNLLSTPLLSGLYKVDTTPSNEFIVRDLITGKAYKGKVNVSKDGILFDNGITGRVDSNGNFIFSSY